MTKRVKVPIEAFRPLAKGKRGLSVRAALTGNLQKLLTEWVSEKRTVGDSFIVEVIKEEVRD